MNVQRLDGVQAFLERAGAFLLRDEPRNNLILGIADTIASTDLYPESCFWIVESVGEVAAAALRTPPHKLILAHTENIEAVASLREVLRTEELPGAVGTPPSVEWFARGRESTVVMAQGVFALERVAEVMRAPGAPRRATTDDRDLVLRWLHDFHAEAISPGAPPLDGRGIDLRLASGGDRGYWLWEDDGAPVSLAGWGGRTPNGVRVGPVYTPPELRGRGYATTLVADLSQWLLDEGRRFCFLYTDLSNPTSNAIYERIGYVRVADSRELAFP